MLIDDLISMLKRHEGLALFPYRCTAGFWTIGYGHNLESKPIGASMQHLIEYGISEKGAERLLVSDLDEVLIQLSQVEEWQSLRQARQSALADMCFNLGFAGLMRFEQMWKAIGRRDYKKAAFEMLESKWRWQVGRRAETLAQIMLSGKMQ